MTPQEAINVAAQEFDTVAAFARALGVKGPTVHQWLDGSRRVPAGRCLKIEEVTGQRVTRYELCPEVFGQKPREAA